jgi:phosphoribosylanthranilate isomerase
MQVRVKICGLRTAEDVAAVAAAGAAYCGFVFFAKSPRHLTVEAARELALSAPEGLCKVALVVDADNTALDAIVEAVPLDMLQLHGRETPGRVAEIKARYGLPVMKAMGVATEADLAGLMEMSLVADQLLIDAKAAPGADLPGGNGVAFDWRLLVGRKWLKPWMLAGGLSPHNVAEAVRLTGARQVDVSSGVGSAPGVKDHAKIAAFVEAAKGTRGGVPILR